MRLGTIAKETGLNWRTVARWAMLKELPERRSMSPKSTTPRKYESYLAQRWTEGFRTARHLLPEIQKLGYTASRTHLEHPLSDWRRVRPGPCAMALSADQGDGAVAGFTQSSPDSRFVSVHETEGVDDTAGNAESRPTQAASTGLPRYAQAGPEIPGHPARARLRKVLARRCAQVWPIWTAQIRLYRPA
jgi:hypothetical protein